MKTNAWDKLIAQLFLTLLGISILIGCGPSVAQIKTWETEKEIEPLIESLRYKDKTIRSHVTWALLNIGEPTVEPLINALTGEDNDIREGAVQVLGRTNSMWVLDPMIAILQNDQEHPAAIAAAAQVLRKLSSSRAVEPLIACLEHKNPEVRKQAAWALEKIGDFRAIKTLEKLAVDEPNKEVREMVRKTLIKIEGRSY